MKYLVCADSGERLLYRGGRCLAHQAEDPGVAVAELGDAGTRACEVREVSGELELIPDGDVAFDVVPACPCRWHQFRARRSQALVRRGAWGMSLEAWLWRHFTREGRRG